MPTAQQTRLAKELTSGKKQTHSKAMKNAGYSPKTIDRVAGRALGSVGVRLAMAEIRSTKSVSARAILDASQTKVLARIGDDPEFALKAMAVATQTLRAIGDESDQINATSKARDVARHLKRRWAYRFLKLGLTNSTRAHRLLAALESHLDIVHDAELVE